MEEFNSADILKKQNRKKRLAGLEVGLFEVSFVLIIIIVLFGLLNYFNILSLSTLYPNQLGFLPHQNKIESKAQKNLTPIPSPTIPPFEKLANQATKEQMLKYLIYMQINSETLESLDPLIEISNGAFSGYNNDTIQITATDKVMNFLVASETTIFKIEAEQTPDPSSSAAASLKVSPNYTFLELIKKIKFGDILQVSYMKTSPQKATEIIFRTNYQVN